MTKVVLSPEAKYDLTEAGDYIAFKLRNKAAARDLIAKVQEAVSSLGKFPESGTPLTFGGPDTAYRYLLCGSYLIFYHIAEDAVCVDRILYGRRDYLSISFGEKLSEEEI